MIRKLVNVLLKVFFLAKKNQRIRPDVKAPAKVNLGAGLTVRPGWINIDGSLNAMISSWPKIAQRFLYNMSGAKQNYSFDEYHAVLRNNRFVCHNLALGIPLVDNCADFIYCSHFLEHLTKQQGLTLIRETYRVLKKGGVARVSVPDLSKAVDLYCSGEKDAALKLLYDGADSRNKFARHKYMYDYEILADFLRDAGFEPITHCQYQQGRTPDIEFLDNRPEHSLFVEAVKE